MNNLEVVFTPEEIKDRRLSDKLVVVIDVLRASSTIVTALAYGCRGLIPILSPELAKEKARQFRKGEVLLGGEREGRKIKGFDLGNSPREYQKEIVENRIIILSTTNGVKILEGVGGGFRVIIASFLNLQATFNYCSKFQGDILLACAGKEDYFSLEDTVCAGMLINALRGIYADTWQAIDANLTAQVLYKKFRSNILGMLQKSQHGHYLESIGLQKDLEFCSQLDIFNIVPVFRKGLIYIDKN